MEDQGRRREPRRRSLLGGKLFDDEGRSRECIVQDMSTTGARVKTEEPFEDRSFLYLKINRFQELLRAEIVWRGQVQLGLRFVNRIVKPSKAMAEFFRFFKLLKTLGDETPPSGGANRPRTFGS